MDKINDFINEWKTFRDNEEEFNNYINSFSKQLIKIDFENYLFDLKFQKKKNY